jgi:23S rRNA (guanosine2251-2'-O)-methyltransferase
MPGGWKMKFEEKKNNNQEIKAQNPASSHSDTLASDIVFGKNAVLEAISSNRTINKILISKGIHGDNKLDKIIELAKQKGVVFQFVAKEKFYQYQECSHQGVIAYVSPIEYKDLDDFLSQEHKASSLVILDGVEDPHNFGAIIRTCVCAGVSGIIIPSHRNVQVNSVVEKTSAGAINRIPIIKVNSLVNAVQKLKNTDWWIIAADASAKDNYYNVDYTNMNFAIILGAEHTGVSKSLLKLSDFTVKIPMLNDFNSLNVSNAAAVVIFETVRQKYVSRTN